MFNINWWTLITMLLPFSMRGNLRDIIYVLTRPFRIIHHQLIQHISLTNNRLSYNCQYPQLQRLLNDSFDSFNRGIRVKEGLNSISEPVIYRASDYQPKFIGLLKVYPTARWGYMPFIVEIPYTVNMSGDPNDNVTILPEDDTVKQIRRLVEIYKLSGIKYSITYY